MQTNTTKAKPAEGEARWEPLSAAMRLTWLTDQWSTWCELPRYSASPDYAHPFQPPLVRQGWKVIGGLG